MSKVKSRRTVEYGDFQTPLALARAICALVRRTGFRPKCVVEPTCGTGSFLRAAHEHFPDIERSIGVDINPDYIPRAFKNLQDWSVDLRLGDFFQLDWSRLLAGLLDPVLVIGNPPWVTNAELARMGSANLPVKSNFQGRRGFEAITGRSNFDIAEWMLIRLLAAIDGRNALLAMLCKSSVARRSLWHVWRSAMHIRAGFYRIDADRYFGASVDAGLLMCRFGAERPSQDCALFERLDARSPSSRFGYRNGRLVADTDEYERCRLLEGNSPYQWRSGIKHDCTRVMEFVKLGNRFRNGLGEYVELESAFLYPLLKSTDLANRAHRRGRWMLVTQRRVGEDTSQISADAPKTWSYLQRNRAFFDKRRSSIYRNRPPFSIFGVGQYAFAPWKVAISGFHKRPRFVAIGPVRRKPVVLDDTCCFVPCETAEEAELIVTMLNSEPARQMLRAFVFPDAKRPITTDVLNRIDLSALAKVLGEEGSFDQCLARNRFARTGSAGRASLLLQLER